MKNIKWQNTSIKRCDRELLGGHKGCVIWLTGLSGSGKSTIASLLEYNLHKKGFRTYLLDGDNIRHGLNIDLGFSKDDRDENIRRIAEVAALFEDAGIITIASFISPYRRMREFAQSRSERFFEVFIDADIEICRQRDVKGLYRKAEEGGIENFTGINDPYEMPENPRLHIRTDSIKPGRAVDMIIGMLKEEGII